MEPAQNDGAGGDLPEPSSISSKAMYSSASTWLTLTQWLRGTIARTGATGVLPASRRLTCVAADKRPIDCSLRSHLSERSQLNVGVRPQPRSAVADRPASWPADIARPVEHIGELG